MNKRKGGVIACNHTGRPPHAPADHSGGHAAPLGALPRPLPGRGLRPGKPGRGGVWRAEAGVGRGCVGIRSLGSGYPVGPGGRQGAGGAAGLLDDAAAPSAAGGG